MVNREAYDDVDWRAFPRPGVPRFWRRQSCATTLSRSCVRSMGQGPRQTLRRPARKSAPIHVVMDLPVDQNQRNALTFRSSRPDFSFAVLLAQDSFTAKPGGLTQTLGRLVVDVVMHEFLAYVHRCGVQLEMVGGAHGASMWSCRARSPMRRAARKTNHVAAL